MQPGEPIQHVALRFRREEKLLVVLAVDISQVQGQIAEQRYRRRTAGNKSPRFSARQHLTFNEQFAVFDLETGRFEDPAHPGAVADFENAGDARPFFTRADHLGRRPSTEQKPESIHHDGFSTAGLARQQVQSRVETHTQPVYYGVALDGQLHQHRADYTNFRQTHPKIAPERQNWLAPGCFGGTNISRLKLFLSRVRFARFVRVLMLHLQVRRQFGSRDPRAFAADEFMGDGRPRQPTDLRRTPDFIDIFHFFLDHHFCQVERVCAGREDRRPILARIPQS